MKRPLRLPGFWGQAAITVTAGLALSTWAYGVGPHVHGVATLEIAIDDAAVQINLNSPLDSLLGFERTPRNQKERQAARVMASKLHQADSLFIFTPAAECRLESARLESPLLPPELLISGSRSGNGNSSTSLNQNDKPKDDKRGSDKPPPVSRAPSVATVFSQPAPLHPALSTEHAAEHPNEHAELEAAWNFRCAVPQALQGLDVQLFHAFPGLRRLDAAIVGPKGQSSVKLTPASTRLKW
ncbi:MAG TPA: DUF2796 domain-containing protein [Nitrosospira sp.]